MVLPQAIVQPESRQLEYAIQLKRQEQAERQRLQMQDDYRKLELMSSIGPAALNKNFDKEVVNATIGDLMNNTKEYLRKNPYGSALELQNFLNTQLSSIAQWSNKVQAIRDKVDEQFKGEDAKNYKIPEWKTKTLSDALYIQNPDGSLKLRGLEELDTNEDYKTSALNKNPELFFKGAEVETDWNKRMRDIPLNKETIEKTVGTKTRRKTEKESIGIPPWMYFDQKENQPKLKTYQDGPLKGLITDEVFRGAVAPNSQEEFKFKLDAKESLASQGIKPDDPNYDAKLELETRRLVGDKLQYLARVERANVDKDNIINVGGSGSGAKSDVPTIDTFGIINDAIDNGTKVILGGKVVGTNLNQLPASVQSIVVDFANKVASTKGTEDVPGKSYNQSNLILNKDSNGVVQLYEYPSFQPLAPLTEVDLNVKGNQPLGTKAKSAAVKKSSQPSASYIINGKTYTMADLTKLGYTQDDINSAIKAGTVKPK